MEINWLGAIVAGIAGFMLGGLWYSPLLFAGIWQREVGVDMKTGLRYPVWLPMVASLGISIIGALALSWLIGRAPGFNGALVHGVVIGFLMVAPTVKMNGLFGQNSVTLISIQALYPALQYTLFGVILGLWR